MAASASRSQCCLCGEAGRRGDPRRQGEVSAARRINGAKQRWPERISRKSAAATRTVALSQISQLSCGVCGPAVYPCQAFGQREGIGTLPEAAVQDRKSVV